MVHKSRYRANPKIQTANIYAEGKRAFTEGHHRAYNPYAKTNLAQATIWWNGWDAAKKDHVAAKEE